MWTEVETVIPAEDQMSLVIMEHLGVTVFVWAGLESFVFLFTSDVNIIPAELYTNL